MVQLRTKFKNIDRKLFPYDISTYKEVSKQQMFRTPLSAKQEPEKPYTIHWDRRDEIPEGLDHNMFIAHIDGNESREAKFNDLSFLYLPEEEIELKQYKNINKNNNTYQNYIDVGIFTQTSSNIEEVIKLISERTNRDDLINSKEFIYHSSWIALMFALYNCPDDYEYIKSLVIKYNMVRRSERNRLTDINESCNFPSFDFSKSNNRSYSYYHLNNWLMKNHFEIEVNLKI
jgi:hypothetical protein